MNLTTGRMGWVIMGGRSGFFFAHYDTVRHGHRKAFFSLFIHYD